MGSGDKAGACAQGIWNSFTTRWLITASTPANRSIPCKVQSEFGTPSVLLLKVMSEVECNIKQTKTFVCNHYYHLIPYINHGPDKF